MKQKHTPAPCSHNPIPQSGYYNIENADGAIIARANKKEDAVLYAAAPELLEALDKLLEAIWESKIENTRTLSIAGNKALTAIKKARGEA